MTKEGPVDAVGPTLHTYTYSLVRSSSIFLIKIISLFAFVVLHLCVMSENDTMKVQALDDESSSFFLFASVDISITFCGLDGNDGKILFPIEKQQFSYTNIVVQYEHSTVRTSRKFLVVKTSESDSDD